MTLAQAKAALGIGDTVDDTAIEAAVESASRTIDEFCGRFFYADDAATYTYTPRSAHRLTVDDVRTVTTLKTDTTGDGTYDTTWAATDYLLEPANAGNKGWPYTQIRVSPKGTRQFRDITNSVQIVGNFGWAAVPSPVQQACLRLTTLVYKTATEGAAPIITMNGGTISMSSRYMDGQVQLLLNPYRRGGIAPGLVVA